MTYLLGMHLIMRGYSAALSPADRWHSLAVIVK